MRRLIRLAARLYPSAWRARYGAEMEILLEDAGPRWSDLLDVLRGALIMQWSSLNFWKIAVGFALAGTLGAGAWSLTLPDRYVSSAMLRATDPFPQHDNLRPRLQAVRELAFSRESLSAIIMQQGLYQKERARLPLDAVIQNMRDRDLHAVLLNDTQFSVSFTYSDPEGAQATVRFVVAALIEANLHRAIDRPQAVNLEVVDPANRPIFPAGPNRPRMLGRGFLAGAAMGILCGALWSVLRHRKQGSLRRIAIFAAGGAAIGMTFAALTPDEFISTAVLRAPDADQSALAVRTALSREALAGLIHRDRLYPRDVAAGRMEQVLEKMRNSALRVQTVETGGPRSANIPGAFTISFQYPDPYLAQRVTSDLVAQITGARTLPVEVLDPPSLPRFPSSPNRPQMAAFGISAGALLGLAASRFRRPVSTAA